jgi:hypothetical protein
MSSPSKLQTLKSRIYDSIFKKPPQTPSKIDVGIPEVPGTIHDVNLPSDHTIDLDAPLEPFGSSADLDTHKVLTTLHKAEDVDASNLQELSDNLRFSVLNKAFADVIIRAGSNSQVITAHKIILASRSSYFYDLFSRNIDLADKTSGLIKLDLTHIVAEPFLKVLDFLYTGVARLKQDDVLDVFSLAEEFGIPQQNQQNL